jgi:hypothetical protein
MSEWLHVREIVLGLNAELQGLDADATRSPLPAFDPAAYR